MFVAPQDNEHPESHLLPVSGEYILHPYSTACNICITGDKATNITNTNLWPINHDSKIIHSQVLVRIIIYGCYVQVVMQRTSLHHMGLIEAPYTEKSTLAHTEPSASRPTQIKHRTVTFKVKSWTCYLTLGLLDVFLYERTNNTNWGTKKVQILYFF